MDLAIAGVHAPLLNRTAYRKTMDDKKLSANDFGSA
jgi:hypothetical protein